MGHLVTGVRLRCAAPGKVNPLILLGAGRPDGRHDQLLLLQSVSLADDVVLEQGAGVGADEVRCPGVDGENLAARAVAAFRAATGWDGPPVRLTITKRVPVAAGMAGGSADAGAALRLLGALTEVDGPVLDEVARGLGTDVPHALLGGLAADLDQDGAATCRGWSRVLDGAVVLLPDVGGLSTGAVYAEADRVGAGRSGEQLAAADAALSRTLDPPDAAGVARLPVDLWGNDLEAPARRLLPRIGDALEALRVAGAERAMVSGSGPTALGWFADRDAAERAARALAGRDPEPVVAAPVARDAGEVVG